jgi:hypothetical protein
MNCNKTRINNIELSLKKNKDLSIKDLLFYLKCNSNNNELNEFNIPNTNKFLKKIEKSYEYQNVFINNSNYQSIAYSVIGLLLPFYYFYPRFYQLGFIGFIIGLVSYFNLYSIINKLYGGMSNNIGKVYIILTFVIYIIFFITFNKLNHISLFFISGILSFLILNYICKLKISSPSDNNEYVKYKTTILDENTKKYTEFNELILTACEQLIKKYNLRLPSGKMLYSYLTIFKMEENKNKYSDFFVNMFGPLMSIYVLWILGKFLNMLDDNITLTPKEIFSGEKGMNLFPLIGFDCDTFKYYTCQANYVLPKELNINILIHELLEKYELNNDKIYDKINKALVRISKEMLRKYNPRFYDVDYKNDDDYHKFLNYINKNVVYKEFKKYLEKFGIDYNPDLVFKKDYSKNNIDSKDFINPIDQIKEDISCLKITINKKEDLITILNHINDVIFIDSYEDKSYENDAKLARDCIFEDFELQEEYKELFGKITKDFIKSFRENLKIGFKNKILNNNEIDLENIENKDKTLFSYYNYVIGYNIVPNNLKIIANNIFKQIIKFFSIWLLLGKPFGSSWLIVKYLLIPTYGIQKFLRLFCKDDILWKYFSMGLNNEYFKNIYENYKIENNSIGQKSLNIFITILLLLLVLPILYIYNTSVFSFTNSPSWYSIIYILLFIINIYGNIIIKFYKKSNSWFIYFNIIFILLYIILTILIYIYK